MVRKGKYKPNRGGPTYLPKDNVRLKIILFLHANSRSSQNRMVSTNSGLSGQKWISMKNILDELCEWEWIEKKQSEDVANVTIYSLLENGQKIAEKIKDLDINSKEFFKLDSFHGLKSE